MEYPAPITHYEPVKYIVKRRAKTKATPDSVIYRGNDIATARDIAAQEQKRTNQQCYIDYTEHAIKELNK